MVYIDIIFNVMYIIDFLMRLKMYGKSYFYKSVMGRQEIFLVITLFFIIFISIGTSFYEEVKFFSFWVTYLSIVLRIFRVSVLFPEVGRYQRVIFLTLKSFIPLLFTMFLFNLFWAVIAHISFQHITLEYNDDFLNEHYNFGDYYRSYVVLLSIGSGNIWTEILQPLQTNQPIYMIVYIQAFFVVYYFLFALFIRAFVMLLLIKFVHRVGNSSSILPGEQLNHFQTLWKSLRKGKNQNSFPLKDLKNFLTNLQVFIFFISFHLMIINEYSSLLLD
jgi:hypothetical protein